MKDYIIVIGQRVLFLLAVLVALAVLIGALLGVLWLLSLIPIASTNLAVVVVISGTGAFLIYIIFEIFRDVLKDVKEAVYLRRMRKKRENNGTN